MTGTSSIRRQRTIPIQIGGYYAYRKPDQQQYSVFRLLDLNNRAYHSQVFSSTYDEVPTLDEAVHAKRFAQHLPIEAAGLLDPTLVLVGGGELTPEDFTGYQYYLNGALGMPEDEIADLVQQLVTFSKQDATEMNVAEYEDGSIRITAVS